MGWDRVGRGEGGSANLTVSFEEGKPLRIRFVAGPTGTKYAEPDQRWVHWPERTSEIGKKWTVAKRGPLLCNGVKNGCPLHQEPLKFRTQKKNICNVIVYEGVDSKGKTYESRSIRLLEGGPQLFQAIRDQAKLGQFSPEEVDWIVVKSGKELDTSYTAIPKTDVLDKEIDLTEFDEQSAYADESWPMLIDYDQLDNYTALSNDEIVKVVEKVMGGEEDVEEAEAEAGATPAAETTEKPKITLPATPARRGRPPASAKPPAASAPAPAAAPPPPPVAAAPPPPPAPPKPKGPPKEEVDKATTLLESWSAGSARNPETLSYVLTTPGFTDEYLAAAKTMIAALEAESASSAATPPPPPAASSNGASNGALDKDALKTRVTEIIKNSPTLSANLANMRAFFAVANTTGDSKNNKAALAKLDADEMQYLIEASGDGNEDTIKELVGA